jgi:cytochrome P450
VKFPKPTAFLRIFSVFGNSIVNTEGEEWHHHRRIVGPAFNEGMNAAVWQTTSDVMLELFSKWEAEVSSPSISVHSFLEIAMEMALLVLCRAGNHFKSLESRILNPSPQDSVNSLNGTAMTKFPLVTAE